MTLSPAAKPHKPRISRIPANQKKEFFQSWGFLGLRLKVGERYLGLQEVQGTLLTKQGRKEPPAPRAS